MYLYLINYNGTHTHFRKMILWYILRETLFRKQPMLGAALNLHGHCNSRGLLRYTLFPLFKNIFIEVSFTYYRIHPFFLSWKIIALQCCVGFCCTKMQISHNFIHTHTHTPSHPISLGGHRVPGWAPCVIQPIPASFLFHT